MNRLMTISTTLGLTGLIVAMVSAFVGTLPAMIALGFVMLAMGFFGAVVGAAAALGRVWDTPR